MLRDLAAEEESPPVPARHAHAFTVGSLRYDADLYWPPASAEAGIVLVPGVAPQGRDDPRLVAFARDLARARFLVLVPEIANLRELQVSAGDADAIADAARHLAARIKPVGVVAISYAAGPAMLAVLREEVASEVGFMVLVGPYYDIEAVVRFFTTGFYRTGLGEPWQHREPNAYGKWVFARSNAERLLDPRDRALLRAIADRRLQDIGAPIDDLRASLGPEGHAVMALLANRDPERVPDLIAALPASIRNEMQALDLAHRDLSGFSADVILVHGRDDAIIPESESRALADALPDQRADLYIVSGLAHADLGDVALGDALTLWRAVYRVLAERDEPADRPISPVPGSR